MMLPEYRLWTTLKAILFNYMRAILFIFGGWELGP